MSPRGRMWLCSASHRQSNANVAMQIEAPEAATCDTFSFASKNLLMLKTETVNRGRARIIRHTVFGIPSFTDANAVCGHGRFDIS